MKKKQKGIEKDMKDRNENKENEKEITDKVINRYDGRYRKITRNERTRYVWKMKWI